MEIKFIKSASKQEQWIQDEKTEFCFIGRSNSGKSSLINAIANKTIAKSSSTPGRTQLVNFFDCGKYRIVDLPGYGFAKLSKASQTNLNSIIQDYLLYRKNLFGVFQICDANVITEQDVKVCKFLQQRFINHFIILNKTDKHPISKYTNNITKYSRLFNVKLNNIIFVSAKTKKNVAVVSKIIKKVLEQIQK